MPLQHLIDTLNTRFIAENELDTPPLTYDGQQAYGHFGDLTFTSKLNPVRLHSAPTLVTAHDAVSHVVNPASSDDTARLLYGNEVPNIVSLDRLSRTVHMLNYLPISHDEGSLFLHVHPHHILSIKKDHGAYFEEILQRCGLPLRRVVITLTLGKSYERHTLLLLERLKNYRVRGYATAIRFDDQSGDEFLERFCLKFLYRFAPDFVRFNLLYFRKAFTEKGSHRRRNSLLAAIRRLDTQLVIGGVLSEGDAQEIRVLNPDYVQGIWYEEGGAFRQNRIAVG